MKRLISSKGQLYALNLLIAGELDKRGKVMVSVKAAPKTLEQLGYLHSEVLPKLTIALFDAGEIKQSSEFAAKLWLKMLINYGEWYDIGGKPVFDAYSFEKADIDILVNAIDTAIMEAQERGVHIQPPRGKI